MESRKPEAQTSNAAPTPTLPKGGGAIRGLGEKFAANPVSGTGSMSVPIATSAGRSGFTPRLSVSYDSGAGNGAFGFGWTLSLPSITRKTDKGLPQYLDAAESDVFILSGAEDLVPVSRQDLDGRVIVHEDEVDGFLVRRYRPRTEGLFARIERWSRIGASADVHWRSISKDNVLTLYGADANSRIFDPAAADRIFSWLICETRDDKGNGMLYRYKAEDGAGVDLGKAHERNRGTENDGRRAANRYLKRIFYGNRTPLLDNAGHRPRFLDRQDIDEQIANADWMFEVVFDFDDHDPATPRPHDDEERDAAGALKYRWKTRADPFSTYRSGFEIRTTRLCQRVLMFHHFRDEADVGRDCLVRSTDFTYSDEVDPADVRAPVYTFLRSITHAGYRRRGGGYDRRSLPPVEFEYTEPIVQEAVEQVGTEDLENLPIGLDGTTYRWTDLHGEGVPGILSEQAGAWFYKRNCSPLPHTLPDGTEYVGATLAPLELVAAKPAASLSSGAEFMDLAGDGQPDVVVMAGPGAGLYEHDDAEGWASFRTFASGLNRDLRDANVKFVDLDGDGQADVLITEDDALVWHPSLAEEGFGAARRVAQPGDEEKGPRVIFADGTQSVYLADLSGDGLADIVRIRNGDVCYWPNIGYGRFGAKVTMDNAPIFDDPDRFDHKRLRLADVDGSGTTDMIYLHGDGVRLYFNQSGNAWAQPHVLKVFPRVDDVVNVVPTDLLGNGTACLVWSSSLPGDAQRPMRYVNLMGRCKPHLLIKTINNLGAETRVDYAPSTKFYLKDKRDGHPWITRLPFPVHVVERIETFDRVSRNRFTTRHAYHHGYFDGKEREFRGFGMVEQWDSERLATLTATGALEADNTGAESHVPPVHTKTWFHTGVYFGREAVSRQFELEYFREPGLTDDAAGLLLLDDTVVPPGLSLDEEQSAVRSLKGSMLRQEIYADDADAGDSAARIARARIPYSVSERNFTIRMLQAKGDSRHAVFFTHARETVSYHYERNPADPRVEHALTLAVDDYGNVLEQAAVAYGRRRRDASLPAEEDRDQQALVHITFTANTVTNAIEGLADDYRTPLAAESRTYEVRRPVQDKSAGGSTTLYRFADLKGVLDQAADGAHDVAYEDVAFVRAQQAAAADAAESARYFRRLIDCVRTRYRPDDCGAALNDPLALLAAGAIEPLALGGESYKLAFTPGLLSEVFQRPHPGSPDESLLATPAAILAGTSGDRGGYVDLDGDGRWWVPSGRSFFSSGPADSGAVEQLRARQHFFLPRRYRDPFGQSAFVDFDAAHDLLMVESRDALGNRVAVKENDYRVLQPRLVSDPNGNETAVAFDALGMVVATAVMGKPTDNPRPGDALAASFQADPAQSQIDRFIDTPRAASADPNVSVATQDAHDLLAGATTRLVYDLTRYMRLGEPALVATIARETHVRDLAPNQISKLQISFAYSDGFGREIQTKTQAEPGPLASGGASTSPRWVGSGWTIFNNKGKPVRQYEPFFSATHRFEFAVTAGVSSVLFYDPAERVIATLHPNHTYEKVVFNPWQKTVYDVNDTCAPRNMQTGHPRTDADIAGYVAAHLTSQPGTWETWYSQGIASPDSREQEAATKAAAHADTPLTAHFDALGRAFLTIARNRVVCPSHPLDGTEDSVVTRVEFDIEGNQRAVRDQRRLPVNGLPSGAIEQRIVMRYRYDLLGNVVHQSSMEGGARWMLRDVTGKLIRAWDSRGHDFTVAYDALRRQIAQTVRGTTTESDSRTRNAGILFDKVEYGESAPNADALNLRTRPFRHFDRAGVTVSAYDFKGNVLANTRQLATQYKEIPDWSNPPQPQLDDERFESSTRYDALDRPIQSITPHSSVVHPQHPNALNIVQPVFNEANLLERLDVWLERAAAPPALLEPQNDAPAAVGIASIEYDAKGRRLRIDYKNGSSTSSEYDPLSYRLTSLVTQRDGTRYSGDDPQTPAAGWPGQYVQNLRYTYDPGGNITHIRDQAQQAIYFRNRRVEASNDYTYDALYRLVRADGREHLGQAAAPIPDSYNDAGRARVPSGNPAGLFAPTDGTAMGTYTERYVYDAVGNFLQVQHERSDAAVPGWTRRYAYAEASSIEPGKSSNRLSSTTVGNAPPETHAHDAHGNMLRMPHLQDMQWDFDDQLGMTRRQRVNDEDEDGVAHEGERTYYVYDGAGQRVRKLTESGAGVVTDERIYLGGVELFRKHGVAAPVGASTATLERETLHVMDGRQRIALVETRTADEGGTDLAPRQLIRYQLGNHLGSVSLELDDAARVVSYEEYSPYGSSTYQAVRSLTETAKRYRYTGKERDEETGLYYHGARHYAPWLGRWTSADKIGLSDGPNLYQYVRSRPVKLVDPNGNFAGDIALYLAPVAGDAAPAVSVSEATALEVGVGGGIGGGEIGAMAPLGAHAAAYFLTAQRWFRRSSSIVQFGNPWGQPTDKLFFPQLQDLREQRAAEWQRRQRENHAQNLVHDGVLTEEQAKDYVRTGQLLVKDAAAGNAPKGAAPPAKKSPVGLPLPPGAVNAKGQLGLPAHGTADLRLNKAGNYVDRNLTRAQRAEGENRDRGTAGKNYVTGVSGETGGERGARTELGYRQQDTSDAVARSQTDFRREVKNYQVFSTVEGRAGERFVPLSDELFTQAVKDAAWVREGAAIGRHRVVQWDFVGAPPSKDLSDMLDHLHIPYQVHR